MYCIFIDIIYSMIIWHVWPLYSIILWDWANRECSNNIRNATKVFWSNIRDIMYVYVTRNFDYFYTISSMECVHDKWYEIRQQLKRIYIFATENKKLWWFTAAEFLMFFYTFYTIQTLDTTTAVTVDGRGGHTITHVVSV